MKRLILLAGGGSAALLAGAFAFQAAGYAPCAMCIWQRWPHVAAIVFALLALAAAPRMFAALGALAALTASGLGLYHTGVERDWWEGPTSCTGSGLGGLSGDDLLSMDGPALVMCDEVAWAFAGLSMASWNAVLSLVLAALWIAAATRRA